jgi:hypothetical protein
MTSEKSKAYISFGIALTCASIYIFVLGYLSYFKVPDYPSWFNSNIFFFATILSKGSSVFSSDLTNTDLTRDPLSHSLPSLAGLLISATTVLAMELVRLRKKTRPKISGPIKLASVLMTVFWSFIISALIIAGAIFIFKDAVLFALPVLLVPGFTLYVGNWILSKVENAQKTDRSILKDTKLDELAIITITLIASWLIPYKMGSYTASKTNPSSSFPSAWSGGHFASNDLLVWNESDKGFWINCTEKIIYGITNEGHVFFFSRSIDDLLTKNKCQ